MRTASMHSGTYCWYLLTVSTSGSMKTLVIGSGGREHALALALSRDPDVTEVHAAPGNPGMAETGTSE